MRGPTVGLALGFVSLFPIHSARAAPEDAASVEAPTGADAEAADPETVDPDPAEIDAGEPESAEPESAEPKADEPEGAELEAPAEPPAPELEPADAEQPELDESDDEPTPDASHEEDAIIHPPRFDGPYVGVVAFGTVNFPSLTNLETPSPLIGTTGFIQAGDAVFPWMSIGIAAGGGAAWAGNQQMFEGALLVEFGFVPLIRYPFSIRAGFGFGGGAVSEPDVPRGGFGGALFKGSARYEFFPLAERKRAARGGGWAIGPELGWLGATPAGPGQPFVNTLLLGLSTSFYFGS